MLSDRRRAGRAHYTQGTMTTPETAVRRGPEAPDISEKGGVKNGQPQRSNDRLFMQLLAFGGCTDPRPLADALAGSGLTGVLYEDVHDSRGVAVLIVG